MRETAQVCVLAPVRNLCYNGSDRPKQGGRAYVQARRVRIRIENRRFRRKRDGQNFEKALCRAAEEINDSLIPKKRKMRKSTGPFGSPTPDSAPSEYDHIYLYNHGASNLFLRLYPNRETNGRIRFPEEGVTWNLYVTILPDYPQKLSEEDPIQEFGALVMEELFRMLPCEKVLLHRQ